MADFDSMFRNWAYTFWMEQHFSNWLNDIERLFTLGDFRVVFGLKPQHFLSLQLQWLVEFFSSCPKKIPTLSEWVNFRLFLHHLMLFSSSMILDAFRIRRMSVYWDRTSDASQIWRNERDDWLYIDESLSIPTIFNVSIEPHTATVCVCVCVPATMRLSLFLCFVLASEGKKAER